MSPELETTIRQFIVNQFIYDETMIDGLTPHTALIDEGIIDSFGVLSIIEFLETEFMINIADDDITPSNMGTIGGIAHLVELKRASAN